MNTDYAGLIGRGVDSAENWQTILQLLPEPHPLQSWAWGDLKSHWGWSQHPMVWEANGQVQAAAMLLKRRIPKTPFCIIYAPKGPLLDWTNVPLRRALLSRLQQIARTERAILLKIDADLIYETGVETRVPYPTGIDVMGDLEERKWQFSHDQIQFRNTVLLDLTPDEDQILANMKSKTRYNIRLAARKGITVRVGTPADFDMIAGIYAETSVRNGFVIRPKSYYLDVWHTFHNAHMLRPLIAEYEGQPIAAIMVVYNHERALYMYGASTNIERKRMPTYLLQWEAIKWAKAHGCKSYDFWGAPDEFTEDDRLWGVWRFKSGFNATVAHHMGAWDYAPFPRLYQLYAEAMPRYLNWLRSKR